MKFKTLKGKIKDIKVHLYKVDWQGDSASKFQESVKDFLFPYWKNDYVCEEFKIAGSKMTLDFYNVTKKIGIEVQGKQHTEYVPFLSGSRSGYRNQITRDLHKQEWCDLNKITLVEIFPDDLEDLSPKWFMEKYKISL